MEMTFELGRRMVKPCHGVHFRGPLAVRWRATFRHGPWKVLRGEDAVRLSFVDAGNGYGIGQGKEQWVVERVYATRILERTSRKSRFDHCRDELDVEVRTMEIMVVVGLLEMIIINWYI